jgi:ATP-dependent Clp protease ATP-binding subunit ClpC
VVVAASEEARGLGHTSIDTEHLLLGCLCDTEGLAARVLASLDVTLDGARAQVVEVVGAGEAASARQLPFAPAAKEALERSLREAMKLGDNFIGSEHILLALTGDSDSIAARVLLASRADAEKIRAKVMPLVSDPATRSARTQSGIRPGFTPLGSRVQSLRLVRGLLNTATDVASDERRSEINSTDLLLALTRDKKTAPLLASFGVDEPAVREAIRRRAASDEPPAASAS